MAIGLFGCQTQNSTSLSPAKEMKDPDGAHTSQNSLDWEGTYRGVLPCSDCTGIQSTITLKKDGTFVLKTKYLGKSDSVFEDSGKFSWNEQGNVVTLTPALKGSPTQYFVGEGHLNQLDAKGTEASGARANRYILTKSNYEILEKYWKLIELNGRAIAIDSTFFKEPHIILKDGGSRVTGNGGCNNISGEYQLENMNRISFSKMISTKMACPRMELEGEFLEMLQKVDNFNVTGDMLILNKARMAPLARFKVVYLK